MNDECSYLINIRYFFTFVYILFLVVFIVVFLFTCLSIFYAAFVITLRSAIICKRIHCFVFVAFVLLFYNKMFVCYFVLLCFYFVFSFTAETSRMWKKRNSKNKIYESVLHFQTRRHFSDRLFQDLWIVAEYLPKPKFLPIMTRRLTLNWVTQLAIH